MPKIDSFKKKKFRSWDNNLLSSLKIKNPDDEIKKDNLEELPNQTKDKINHKHDNVTNSLPNIPKNKEGSNRVQEEFKKGSSRVRGESNQSSVEVQARFKQGSSKVQKEFKESANRVQNDAKIKANSVILSQLDIISRLPRNEQLIFKYVVQICQNHNALETGLIPSSALDQVINSTRNSRETAIKRLVKKGLIIRKPGNPRQGTINLSILREVKEEAINFFISNPFNHAQKVNVDFTEFNTSLSSSSNIDTTTTLSNEWKNINFEALREYGFSEKHILQISKLDSITPDELQSSINHFVFDLQENNKIKDIQKSPIAFFMGIMRGQGIYVAPKNYESPQDRKLRLKVEQQKRESERRDKLKTELVNIEFEKWQSKLTNSDMDSLIPDDIKNAKYFPEPQKKEFLKNYFVNKFWDKIKQEKHADCFE